MAVESFLIDLRNKDQAYTIGDTICGEVRLELNSLIKLTGLEVCFSGRGKVECARGRSIYIGREEYYSHSVCLLDEVQIRNMGGILKAGTHCFPFLFRIPFGADLPGSHTGKRGYIRYTIEARMKKPNQIVDDTSVVTVPVVDFVVVEEHLLKPQRQQLTTSVGLTHACTSDSISVTASLNRAGYYIGDEVLASLCIDNSSRYDITEVEMHLLQKTTYSYRTKRPKRQDKEKQLSHTRTTGVPRGHDKNIENLCVPIPRIKPTSLDGIIKTEYSIEIALHFDKKFIKDLQFSFPVLIGNMKSSKTAETMID